MIEPASASLPLRLALIFWASQVACVGADALDTWSVRHQPQPAVGLNGVTFAKGLFVAAGGVGNPDFPGTTIITSSNGVDWIRRNSNSSDPLKAVTCGDTVFVAVGGSANLKTREGVIVVSADGVTWTNIDATPLPDLNAVTWGKGLFVAVGFDWSTLTSAIVSSPDGVAWTRVELPEAITNSGIITCVAFGDGIFVAGTFSPGDILVSTNGLSWTKAIRVGGFHRGVVYGNGTWAAAGGPQIFVGGAAIWTSPDLTNWTPRSVPGGGPNYYPAIAFGNGAFCVPGNWGNVAYSRNTTDWALRDVGGQQAPLSGIAYGNGTFVAVGPSGTILQSDDVRVPRLTALGFGGAGFGIKVSGEIGRPLRVQTSDDLVPTNWNDLLIVTNTTATTNLADPTAASISRRFYRAISP